MGYVPLGTALQMEEGRQTTSFSQNVTAILLYVLGYSPLYTLDDM